MAGEEQSSPAPVSRRVNDNHRRYGGHNTERWSIIAWNSHIYLTVHLVDMVLFLLSRPSSVLVSYILMLQISPRARDDGSLS